MKVINAYRRRSVPDEHGTWGNDSVKAMVERFPWLEPLVETLRIEDSWSKSKPRGKNAEGWTALFFEDFVRGRGTKISLTIKPARKSLMVPSLPLIEYVLPTLRDLELWIIANIRKRG